MSQETEAKTKAFEVQYFVFSPRHSTVSLRGGGLYNGSYGSIISRDLMLQGLEKKKH